jgi:hypothetical protein
MRIVHLSSTRVTRTGSDTLDASGPPGLVAQNVGTPPIGGSMPSEIVNHGA